MQNRPFLDRYDTSDRPCITDFICIAENQGGTHGQPRPHALDRRVILKSRLTETAKSVTAASLISMDRGLSQRYRLAIEWRRLAARPMVALLNFSNSGDCLISSKEETSV
jgi:hypothetical protein